MSINWNYGTGHNVTGLTPTEMVEKSGLTWEVNSAPQTYGEFQQYTHPTDRTVWNSSNGEYFGIYGNRKVRQNTEIVTTLNKIFKISGLSMTNLGSYGGGKFIYGSAELPGKEINVKQVGDIIKPRMIILDSHINGEGMKFYVHFDRLVCTNGLTQPVNQNVGVVNHTNQLNTANIQKCVVGCFRTIDKEDVVLNMLAECNMSASEAALALVKAFGQPDKSLDKQPAMVKQCLELFQGKAQGAEMLSAYNTAHGLLQAVTEFYSHETQSQSTFASIMNGTYAQKTRDFQAQLVRAYR